MKFSKMKAARMRADLKALEVCKLLGFNHSRLSLIENLWSDPSEAELKALSKLYKVKPQDLIESEEIFAEE